jgi:hypothetical protein
MAKPKRGRPALPPDPTKKSQLSVMVTATIKLRLEQEARRQGRTMSQEAEARLERSFDRQDLLTEVMEPTYGGQTMALLLILGEAMRTTAGLTQAMWALERGISPTVLDLQNTDHHDRWLHDPRAFASLIEAIRRVLEGLQPTDDVPKQSDDAKFKWEDIPDYVATPILRALQYGSTDPRMIAARRHLGDLIAHVAKKKRKEKPAE